MKKSIKKAEEQMFNQITTDSPDDNLDVAWACFSVGTYAVYTVLGPEKAPEYVSEMVNKALRVIKKKYDQQDSGDEFPL